MRYSKYDVDIFSEVYDRFSKFKAAKLIRGLLPDFAYNIINKLSEISYGHLEKRDFS